MHLLFSSVFLTNSLEVSLIRDQGWINVGAYGPKRFAIFS